MAKLLIGEKMSPALAAWLAKPEGLFDLSSSRAAEDSVFKDFSQLPPLPAPKAPAAPRVPAASRAPAPAPMAPKAPAWMEGMREHKKWDEPKDRVGIECPYCGEEAYASQNTLAQYGKSCPRCGSKHLFDGRTREATPQQRAFAQRTFGKPKPEGGWFAGSGRNAAPARRSSSRRTPARSYR